MGRLGALKSKEKSELSVLCSILVNVHGMDISLSVTFRNEIY